MGQILHGSTKTTHAVRTELQRSQASASELSRRFGINEKTVRKWRSRQTVEDEPMKGRWYGLGCQPASWSRAQRRPSLELGGLRGRNEGELARVKVAVAALRWL